MTLPPLASVDEFEDRLPGELADRARAVALIDDASLLVRRHTGRTWLTDDGWVEYTDLTHDADITRDTLAQITRACAMRAFENPEGTTMKTIGGFTEQRSTQTASNACWLMDEEKAALLSLIGMSGGLVSIPVSRPEGEFPIRSDIAWLESADLVDPASPW